MEEHVPVPKRVYVAREDLELFGVIARFPLCLLLLTGTAKDTELQNAD